MIRMDVLLTVSLRSVVVLSTVSPDLTHSVILPSRSKIETNVCWGSVCWVDEVILMGKEMIGRWIDGIRREEWSDDECDRGGMGMGVRGRWA